MLRDDNGSPLLLWHGDSYSPERPRVFGCQSKGFGLRAVFFAVEPSQAESYDFERRRNTAGTPRCFYVRSNHLLNLTLDTPNNRAFIQSWAAKWNPWIDRVSGEPIEAWDLESGYMYDYEGTGSAERWNDLFAEAQAQGYNAVKTLDATDGCTAPVVVTFSPALIKSATWNSGQFSLGDPDVYDGAREPAARGVAETFEMAQSFARRLGVSLAPTRTPRPKAQLAFA